MPFDPAEILTQHTRDAIGRVVSTLGRSDLADADPLVTASRNPKFGDFQCNAAMSLGKLLGKPPREIAIAIRDELNKTITDIAMPLTEASIAGPGFINIMLRADALPSLLARLDSPTLGFDAPPMASRPVAVVDLCGVNLAKQMHVGHIRATIIGDTLARILDRTGWRVLRQNHIGDWGLPIAMVTARLMEQESLKQIDLNAITLDDLDTAYRAAKRECEADDRGLSAARHWHMGPKVLAELEAQVGGAKEKYESAKDALRRLQVKDPAVYRVWQRISDVTMSACLEMCKRLNSIVLAEHSASESMYSDVLAEIVEIMQRAGITEVSQGALVVRLDDEGIAEPLIIRKSDGAFLYSTTDLAAIRHRVQTLGASRVVYCVDARQSLHFRQVFAASRKGGFAKLGAAHTNAAAGLAAKALGDGKGNASLEHAAFGTILGEDNKPFKTRSGENVKLSDLLDQAYEAALKSVGTRGEEFDAVERAKIATAVSIAAIRYVDLSTERIKDYVFSFDRMMSHEGNTGPYLLYAVARIRRIFRQAAERGHLKGALSENSAATSTTGSSFSIIEPAEKNLSLALLRFPAVVADVARTLEPSRLCAYLYELASAYSTFYDQCPVLNAPDEPSRTARLHLCKLTQRVLVDGLGLLGMPTLERM